MSCCGPSTESEKQSKQIEQELRKDKSRLENEVKLLLLGAGESGKSTIAKQMKIIHKDGFTAEERATYKSNIVSSMRVLIRGAQELGIEISEAKEEAGRIAGDDGVSAELTAEMATDIKALWKDPGIKAVFAQASKLQLIDSASYYLEDIDRFASPDFTPTEQDVLRSRTMTTGIIEIHFDVEKTHFLMIDVGGQRSERKKWMHCFQDVTAVLFCVAMSEYDLTLREDESTNRMHESLKLFKEICNSTWFSNTSMILFLNKKDLFEEKIANVDLNVCFPEYKGGKNFKSASQFITDKFLAQNENPKKVVYTHLTCATDTGNVKLVFKVVKDIVIRSFLDQENIM